MATPPTPSKSPSLGRYFDNSGHTIFDEILASPTETQIEPDEVDILEERFAQSIALNDPNESPTPGADDALYQQHRDAWIPSEDTRRILRAVASGITTSHEREHLTQPVLSLQDDLAEPAWKLVTQLLGEDEPGISPPPMVSRDERGLRELISTGHWRAAVDLTTELIPLYQGAKHSPHSLQLWLTRLALLAKLKLAEPLEREARSFGDLDKPDMYYAFYPEVYGARRGCGSMAPFALRLLLAQAGCHCGKPRQALDPLFRLLSTVRKILSNLESGLLEDGASWPASSNETERTEALRLWRARYSRVLLALVNCALAFKNYSLALDLLERILEQENSPKAAVVSAIGRLYLLLGDVAAAEARFAESRRLGSNNELVDRGLTAIAQNAFQEALDSFNAARHSDPGNVALANNIAVALLYTGKLETALHLLESALGANPAQGLQEHVILNLCTLYELHTTHNRPDKLQLLRQIVRNKGDALDINCLKVSVT